MNNLEELKEFAKTNSVPIILDEGLDFLIMNIKKYEVKNVLEIGTAIGYSAINMALNGVNVTSIERDEKMYNLALDNIKDFNLDSKITIIKGDALEVFDQIKEKYDLIFIDAAKGQYRKFFDIYSKYLSEDGIIICDNMDFHGLADSDLSKLSKNLRQMLRKLNDFKDYLNNNNDYKTDYYHIGDGLTISKRV